MTKLKNFLAVLLSFKDHANRKKFIFLLREYLYGIKTAQQATTSNVSPYKIAFPDTGRQPKILLVIHQFSRTGAPYAVLYLARALYAIYGTHPVILSSEDGPLRAEFSAEKFPTIVDPTLLNYWSYSAEACEFISHFDKVIVTSLASYNFIRIFRGIAKHLTWWLHETAHGFENISIISDIRLCFAACETIWLGSPICFPHALNYAPQDKLHLLVYGCPDTAWPSRQHPSGKLVFSLFGSIEERKGQDLFVDAIEKLPDELRKNAIFRIIGSPLSYGITLDFFNTLSARFKNIPEIEHFDNMPFDELQNFYAETDVFVSTSRDDPMPIVITQGLMFAKTCLCSSAIGQAELLEDGVNGLIFSSGSADALSEKMAWIMQNSTQAINIGLSGRKLYEKYFLMDSFTANVQSLMHDMH